MGPVLAEESETVSATNYFAVRNTACPDGSGRAIVADIESGTCSSGAFPGSIGRGQENSP